MTYWSGTTPPLIDRTPATKLVGIRSETGLVLIAVCPWCGSALNREVDKTLIGLRIKLA